MSLELTFCFFFFSLSCFGVLLCACLSPWTWTVCLWKPTFTHVNKDTWSLNVFHYQENWETWLQSILRSLCVLAVEYWCEYIWQPVKQPFGCLQKAIMECDEEWAMNKKVVDLSSKDVRQSVSPFCSSEERKSEMCSEFLCSLLICALVNTR